MATFKDIEEAGEYFKKDRFATDNGVRLDELSEEKSVCSLILDDSHKNANGGIMGGVIFTLADFAFATLSNIVHMPTVAQQVSINYLGAPKGDKLVATSMIKKNGRSSIIINVDVVDDTGRDIAQFIGTGFKL